MSDAGDDTPFDASAEVEVTAEVEATAETAEAPKGKLTVEEALQVRSFFLIAYFK
jgi:hypothetical protein